eukprot:Gb_34647 [translate_table: standard]
MPNVSALGFSTPHSSGNVDFCSAYLLREGKQTAIEEDTVFEEMGLTDEEMAVDPQLGYPRGYANLCRHLKASIQMPYSQGPPHTFLPYILQPQDVVKLKELNQLFPITVTEETDPLNSRKYADILWKQLDHLGNAGFDPAKFRVDPYGNVLYLHADPASPLSWEVDHWFPHSRSGGMKITCVMAGGGKTVPSNLRLVQWQVKQMKQNKLEFLVPWWDLQLGVSVSQFLSIFASKNADFRQRAFSLMFFSGKSEQLDEILVVDCHSWPQHFLEKKRQFGIAPAAIVRVQKEMDGTLKPLNSNRRTKPGANTGRRWVVEEDEAVCKAIQNFRPGYSKESKEFEPMLTNNSIVQMKDTHRLKKGDLDLNKENMSDLENMQMTFSRCLQKETSLKQIREQEIRKKQDEIAEFDQELMQMKQINEAERLALEDLESVLMKHKRRAEKQRRLAETQSSYRVCIEKMIRDAMHQNVVYKEQARLNQAACNALMARLESQKADCDTSERELLKKFKQREDIEELLRPYSEQVRKRLREDDTASCYKKTVKKEMEKLPTCSSSAITGRLDEKEYGRVALKETTLLLKNMEENTEKIQKELRLFLEEDQEASKAERLLEAQKEQSETDVEETTAKEKSNLLKLEENEENAMVRYEYGGAAKAESVGDNVKEEVEEDLDDVLQQVLAMQGNAEAGQAGANAEDENEDENERIQRVGKSNLDKWLQMLLQNTQAGIFMDEPEGKGQDVPAVAAEEEEKPRGLFGGLLDKLSLTLSQHENKEPSIAPGIEEKKYTEEPIVSNPSASRRTIDEQNLKPNLVRTGKVELVDDGLDLSENLHCLKLTCNDEINAEYQKQQHTSAVTMPVNADAGLRKKHKKTTLTGNSNAEFHKKAHKMAAATTVYADAKVKHGRQSLPQKEEKRPDNCITDQTGGDTGMVLRNSNIYNCSHQIDQETGGGMGIRSSTGDNSKYITGKKAGEMAISSKGGDGDVMQQRGKECILKRSESGRGQGLVASVASPSSLWGGHRGGQCIGRKMMVIGEEWDNEEEGGKLEELKVREEDQIKNGVKASIKSCTRVWKRAVKRGNRSELID